MPVTRDSIFLNTEFGTYVTSKSNPEVFVSGCVHQAGLGALRSATVSGKSAPSSSPSSAGVLGDTLIVSEKETDRQLKELRDRYFSSYTRAWADFLHDLEIRKPANNDEALDELNALSEVPWPYLRLLLRTLDENTCTSKKRSANKPSARSSDAPRRKLLRNNAARSHPRRRRASSILRPTRWVSPPEQAFGPMTKFGVPTPSRPGSEERPQRARRRRHPDAARALPGPHHLQARRGPHRSARLEGTRRRAEGGHRGLRGGHPFGTNELMTPTQSGFTRPVLSPAAAEPHRAQLRRRR